LLAFGLFSVLFMVVVSCLHLFVLFVPAVAGFTKRLRIQYVPYATVSEIQAYLQLETNMTAEQAQRTTLVTGASMHDVGLAVAVALNKTSQKLEQPLQGNSRLVLCVDPILS
jgi:triphosphoribosyl-dephospho-CoA synthetase